MATLPAWTEWGINQASHVATQTGALDLSLQQTVLQTITPRPYVTDNDGHTGDTIIEKNNNHYDHFSHRIGERFKSRNQKAVRGLR